MMVLHIAGGIILAVVIIVTFVACLPWLKNIFSSFPIFSWGFTGLTGVLAFLTLLLGAEGTVFLLLVAGIFAGMFAALDFVGKRIERRPADKA